MKVLDALDEVGRQDIASQVSEALENVSVDNQSVRDAFYRVLSDAILFEHGKYSKRIPKSVLMSMLMRNRRFYHSFIDYDLRDTISKVMGYLYPKYDFGWLDEGPLGEYDHGLIATACTDLTEKGYHIFERRLGEGFCDQIIDALARVRFHDKSGQDKLTGLRYEQAAANTYWVIEQQDVASIPQVQKLIMDPCLLRTVQDYLRCAPIFTQSNCWWSVQGSGDRKMLSSSAQLFHRDMPYPKFLKVFIYLDDVGPDNGPHMYVPYSHRENPGKRDGLNPKGRKSDEQIASTYGEAGIREMTGRKGTVLLEDTSGFHKGKPVIEGKRILLQLEFCSTTFNGLQGGLPETTAFKDKSRFSDEFLGFIERYPRLFKMHFH